MSGMTNPFIIVIARYRLHASPLQISLLTMAPVSGYLLSLLWANMMHGRRRMPYAVWPWVIARSLFFLVAFATCSKAFVAIMVGFYVLSSVASPAYTDLIQEMYPDADRARIMGYVRVCTVVATIALTMIVGWLSSADSYRIVFPIAAVFGVASALVFSRIPTSEAYGDASIKLHNFIAESVRLFVEDKGYLWCCAGTFIFGIANFMVSPLLAIYEVDTLRAHEAIQSVYNLVVLVVAMLSYAYWGALTDRKQAERVVALQVLMWVFVPLSYLLASHWWMLLPTKALAGFIGAGTELSYFIVIFRYAPKGRVAQYQAVFLTLTAIRGLAGSPLGTALVEWRVMNAQAVMVLSAALTLLSVFVLLWGHKKYPTPVRQ